MRSQKPWIRYHATWPDFMFDHAVVAGDLAAAYRMHGVIEGKARAIGLTPTSPMALEATAEEVVATAAIEGERLSMDSVRSSVMRRLGLAVTGQADRHIDGLVAVIDDAMNQYARLSTRTACVVGRDSYAVSFTRCGICEPPRIAAYGLANDYCTKIGKVPSITNVDGSGIVGGPTTANLVLPASVRTTRLTSGQTFHLIEA